MPWLTDWNYRKAITITNTESALTDYQAKITITYANAMQTNFNDIRFTYPDNTNIPYWIESKTDGVRATVWIKVDLPNYGASPTGDNIIYMYYGNASITSASDFNSTMINYVDYTVGTLYDHANTDWTPSNGEVISGTHYNIRTFVVASGYNVHLNTYDGTSHGRVNISALDMNIYGTLNATGKGYRGATVCNTDGEGPGAGLRGPRGGGAGYGGYGGGGGGPPRSATYGNESAPNYMGSGGATSPNFCRGYAGSGGGRIILRVIGTLRNDGTISANGTNSQAGVGGSNGGGGSGGTIYVDTNILTGSGYITANGGSDPDGCCGGGGGGGRIAIYYNSTSYTGQTTVTPGTGWESGGIGTIYTHQYASVTIGQEETPANITATDVTVSHSIPCIEGTCIVTADVTWTNTGTGSGDFVPNIKIDGNIQTPVYPLQSLAAGTSVTKSFTLTGLSIGIHTICPDPN